MIAASKNTRTLEELSVNENSYTLRKMNLLLEDGYLVKVNGEDVIECKLNGVRHCFTQVPYQDEPRKLDVVRSVSMVLSHNANKPNAPIDLDEKLVTVDTFDILTNWSSISGITLEMESNKNPDDKYDSTVWIVWSDNGNKDAMFINPNQREEISESGDLYIEIGPDKILEDTIRECEIDGHDGSKRTVEIDKDGISEIL